MTCDEVERDDVAEQYLLGRLDEPARSEFEAHYFECTRCRERLALLDSVRTVLVREGLFRRRARRYWPALGALATAALVVMAVWTRHESAPVPTTAAIVSPAVPPNPGADRVALGAIEPPLFAPMRLRSGSHGAFRDAMRAYQRRDYAGAIPGLQRAVEADPRAPQALFYLAVCELELHRDEQAIDHLARAAGLGESPIVEDAHFFLAKARIRRGEIDAARRELRRVLALRGERQAEAERLLAALG